MQQGPNVRFMSIKCKNINIMIKILAMGPNSYLKIISKILIKIKHTDTNACPLKIITFRPILSII